MLNVPSGRSGPPTPPRPLSTFAAHDDLDEACALRPSFEIDRYSGDRRHLRGHEHDVHFAEGLPDGQRQFLREGRVIFTGKNVGA